MQKVIFDTRDAIAIVTINRPEVRNAIDFQTAHELVEAFKRFDEDETLKVAVFTGAGGVFCAGADLKAISEGNQNPLSEDGEVAPMGVSRMLLSKPVIAAVEGYAVAGGLELALWCDLRVAARDAVFGVFCRRFGVPLIDLGTIRLPRLIGHSRAMDLILTGRAVSSDEAVQMGLANRLAEKGKALEASLQLAKQIAAFPQSCMRSDRLSAYEQWELSWSNAQRNEFRRGFQILESGESRAGATRFKEGQGRGGSFNS